MSELSEKAAILPLLDCNAHCPFCSTRVYTDHGVLSPADFNAGNQRLIKQYTQTLEEVQRTYDQLLAQGIRRFTLQGGEPTLWEDLPAILEYGRRAGATEQTIISNGRRFRDPAYTARLLAAAPTTIVLSLFGACAETHDASLGVRGAFEDVSIGVEHLLAATRTQPPERRTSLMAQISIHAKNYAELPAIFRFWYDKGLRDFSVRLLRETLNTAHQPSDNWFFDLAKLQAPLEETLDFTLTKRDLFVSMSEIFYCLLSPSYFGFVMRDIGTNPNLHGRNLHLTKHHGRELPERESSDPSVCGRCDLRAACLPLEDCHRARFSGELTPIDVTARVEALATARLMPPETLRLKPLIEAADRLTQFGVPRERIAALSRVHLAALRADGPQALVDAVLLPKEQETMRALFERHSGEPTTVSVIRLSELNAEGPLSGDRLEVLARLSHHAPPDKARVLEVLRDRTESVLRSRALMVFASVRRVRGVKTVLLVLLVDDLRLDDDSALRLMDFFRRQTSPSARLAPAISTTS